MIGHTMLMPAEVHAAVKALARRRGCSMQAVYRAAIERYLAP